MARLAFGSGLAALVSVAVACVGGGGGLVDDGGASQTDAASSAGDDGDGGGSGVEAGDAADDGDGPDGGDDQADDTTGPADDGDGTGTMTTTGASDDGDTGDEGGSDDGPPPMVPFAGLCFDDPPDGAAMPAALPDYSGEACPAIVPGLNTIDSLGNARQFIVVVPSDLSPDEVLPVAFLWHWLGGDADSFLEEAHTQDAVDELRFIAVIPEDKGDLPFRWPFSIIDSDARMQEEFLFFDDMLACVAQAYPIAQSCVTSVGVSAGALWTAQLVSARSEHLASAVSLSGGTGGLVVKPWMGAAHRLPMLVLWGGPTDFCVAVDFQQTSQDLEAGLTEDGHAIVECIHNCAHSAPPFDPPEGMTEFAPMWKFFLDHPYWIDEGVTPWSTGVPEGTPLWCDVGMGTAEIRVGECGPSACSL